MKTKTAIDFTPAQHYVFHNMDWEGYQKILDAVGEHRLRHTYDEGILEIISPSWNHEYYKKIISKLIDMMCFELGISIQSLGSVTMSPELKSKGLEPDECYLLTKRVDPRVLRKWDALRDPAPDLAIEIEVTNPVAPRLPIFARLGIAEVWSFDGQELRFLQLIETGGYQPIEQSLAFPFLCPQDLMTFLDMVGEYEENAILHKLVDWLRAR